MRQAGGGGFPPPPFFLRTVPPAIPCAAEAGVVELCHPTTISGRSRPAIIRKNAMRSLFAAAAAVVVTASAAGAADVNLPEQLSWTAYGTTSSGYAQSIGLGNMLKAKYDVDLRVIPGKNDVSRMLPLKANQAEICACGIAAYFGQEGVLMFAN